MHEIKIINPTNKDAPVAMTQWLKITMYWWCRVNCDGSIALWSCDVDDSEALSMQPCM